VSKYRDAAKQMVQDYKELEELTQNNSRGIPHTALGKKYNIDSSYAGNLWRGVRMGILQISDDTKYGKAVKKMYNDNVVQNIDTLSYKEVDEFYNVQGNAGMALLLGLEAAMKYKSHHKANNRILNEITSEHIRRAVKDYNENIIEHHFKDSTNYDVIIDSNRYPPKAIIGLATRYVTGQVLNPLDLNDDIATKYFEILQREGFKIIPKSNEPTYPDEVPEKEVHYEGSVKQILVNRYERDTKAKDKCIEYYGLKCRVCSFDFKEVYGELGIGFIHVHHLTPISEIGEEYKLDPVRDLRPVCPNCHAMLHKKIPPISIEQLKKKIM